MSAGLYYLLYTQSGQGYIAKTLEKKLSAVVGRDISLEIENMALSPTHLDASMLVDGAMHLDLSGFRSLTGAYDIGYRLRGEDINISGQVEGLLTDFTLKGEGVFLDGVTHFSLRKKEELFEDVEVQMQHVDAAKFAQLLGELPLVASTFSLQAKLPKISASQKVGDVHIVLDRGGVYLQNIYKLFSKRLPSDFMMEGEGDIQVVDNTISFDAKVLSNIGRLTLQKGQYSEPNHTFKSHYMFETSTLEKFTFVTKKRYVGAFKTIGDASYHDSWRCKGSSESLKGSIAYIFEKEKWSTHFQDISLKRLLEMMGYPAIMIGDASGKANYDIKEKIAIVNMESPNMHFAANGMTKKILEKGDIDLSKELFTQTFFSGAVQGGVVSYDFSAKNDDALVALSDVKMDAHNNTIKANFALQLQGEELYGEIFGSLKHPQVSIDMSRYIKFKAQKEMDGFFGMGTTQKVKEQIKKIKPSAVKGFIKGFFK